MRIYQLLVKTLLVITLGLCIDSSLSAQKNRLPSGLTENSSLEEVLGWLDKMALAQARVGRLRAALSFESLTRDSRAF